MTYNPRIKNRKNNKLQVTGSLLTGSVADFNIVSGSTITGSTGYFTTVNGATVSGSTATFSNLTVDTLNISTPINTTASYANNAGLLDGLDSTAFVQSANLVNVAVTSLTAGNGLTGTDTTGSVTLAVGQGTGIVVDADTVSIDTSAVVTITGSQTITGAKTLSANLSGTTAEFTSVTASLLGNVVGTASHATTAGDANTLDGLDSTAFVQSSNLANVAVTSLAAGNGLTGTDTTGSITLAVGQGTGIVVDADTVSIDTAAVVTITGSQTITGAKTLSANLSGTTAEFTSVTASFSGNGSGLTNIPNGALQNSSITINGETVSLGGTITVGDITEVVAGDGLTGGGSSGSLTLTVGQGDGISVTADAVAVDSTVVRTSGNQSISGVKTFNSVLTASQDVVFEKNIFVNGTASIGQLNTLYQTSLVVGDKYITILSGAADHTSLDKSGILWGSGGVGPTVDELGANAHIRYSSSLDALSLFPGLNVEGDTTLLAVSGTTAEFTTVTASLASVGTLNVTTVAADSVTATAMSTNVTGVSANFDLGVLGNKHIILVDATAEVTGTLPLAANVPYRQYIFKKTDSTENVLAISASGGETIDGESKVEVFAQYETLTIVSDGVNKWFIV